MAVIEIRGGRIDRRYLDRKTKHELATMYLELLDSRERVVDALAEAVMALRGAVAALRALPVRTCGGDLCVCLNYGEKPCPECDGDPGDDDWMDDLPDGEGES